MLALAVLWDLAVALLKGHQIVFEDKSGVRKDYHPLIDPKGFETTQ
ncbi:MAG TPA: hypothetical protein VFA15_06770 [Nitrososphaera sp.]|nr:hypothetical protein [Nitrososphaera sp.]